VNIAVFFVILLHISLGEFTSGDATGSYGATGAPQAAASGDPRAFQRDGLEDFPQSSWRFRVIRRFLVDDTS